MPFFLYFLCLHYFSFAHLTISNHYSNNATEDQYQQKVGDGLGVCVMNHLLLVNLVSHKATLSKGHVTL